MIKIMKLTNEEKAKVLAMYWGNELDVEGARYRLSDRSGDPVSYGVREAIWNRAKLCLSPPSKISDEHAIIIAKIVYSDWTELRIEDKALKNWLIQEGKKYIQRTSKYDYDVADKLRELGYMLPYKGIDLFESGLAIDKTLLTLPV